MLCGGHAEHVLVGVQLVLGTRPAHHTAKSALLGLPLWQTTCSPERHQERQHREAVNRLWGRRVQRTDSNDTAHRRCDMRQPYRSCVQYRPWSPPKTRLLPGKG